MLLTVAWVPIASAQSQDSAATASGANSTSASSASDSAPSADGAPSYTALANLLEDRQSRQVLVEQLRDLANTQPSAASDAAAGQGGASTSQARADQQNSRERSDSMGGMAGTLQAFAAGMASDFSETATVLRRLFAGEGVQDMTAEQWKSRLLNLGLVIVATLVAFGVFRLAALWFFRRLDAWVQRSPATAPGAPSSTHSQVHPRLRTVRLTPRVGAIVGALAIDAGAILLAALVGYALSLFIQEQWHTSVMLALIFVSAFVAIELSRSLCRAIFSERHPHLRLWRMDDEPAKYWSSWLQRIISLTGYGMLVAVPVVQQMVTPSMGQLVGLFIMLGVYIYAIRVIWAKRHDVRQRLEQRAELASNAFFSTLYRIAGRLWHWVGTAYFTALLISTQVAQEEALPFMAAATLRTLIVVGIATLLAAALSSLLARRITLSEDMRSRMPLLEHRLNSYVPSAIRLMRGVILVVSALLVLDAWRAFNLSAWLYSPEGRSMISTLVHVAVILLFAMGIWTVVASIIESRLNDNVATGRTTERQKTLLSLFRSAALAVIVTLTVLVVLSQIGVDIGPLIAGAGVVGLAIGFGARKLVEDVITGVFIQLENGMNHNDVVEVAGIFGTVEKITIRSVGIRTLDGGYHLIPFSAIDKVSNHMRDFGYHYGEYAIAYGADVDEAVHHLRGAFDDFMSDPDLAGMVLDKIDIPGVTSLNERGYNIRVLIKTVPGMQWAVQRGFNRLVRKRFAEAGIDLPYPQTVLHFAKPQPGDADALALEQVAGDDNSTVEPGVSGNKPSGPLARGAKPFDPQTQGPAPSGPDTGGGPDGDR